MKILIPSCKSPGELAGMIQAIHETAPNCEVIASCLKASAAINRNACLDKLEAGETAIMLDDDVCGFDPNWVDDLLVGLTLPGAVMVSARLLKPDGTFAQTCSDCYLESPMEIPVTGGPTSILPTACIAFVNTGHRYDPAYRGSGFEDSDLCFQIRRDCLNPVFVQSNRCRVVHLNEQKSQGGQNWRHNRRVFRRKWGV